MEKKLLLLLSSCLICFASCDDKTSMSVSLSASQLEAIGILGFDSDDAKILSDGNILVEGDIVFTPASLDGAYQKLQENENNEVNDRQRTVAKASAAPYPTTSNLTFSIQSGFTAEQMSAIRAGVTLWLNGTNNIVLNEVSSASPANIIIYLDNNLGENTWGRTGVFPTGDPISTGIALNISETIEDCTVDIFTCIRNLTAHEIGHALGFHHTDLGSSQLLLGSPENDPSSIMNSGNAIGGMAGYGTLTGPNANDIDMASALYPANGLAIELTRIQINPSMGGEFVTMSVDRKSVV